MPVTGDRKDRVLHERGTRPRFVDLACGDQPSECGREFDVADLGDVEVAVRLLDDASDVEPDVRSQQVLDDRRRVEDDRRELAKRYSSSSRSSRM